MRRSKNTLMCLKCRGTGHTASRCKNQYVNTSYEWFVSPERADFADDHPKVKLCQRCCGLNIIQYLEQEIPWESSFQRTQYHDWPGIRNLGTAGSIIFHNDCPLCRCLFALTPTPSSDDQNIIMLPNWTVTRHEGGIVVDTPAKRRSARGLLITLSDEDGIDLSKDSILDRGDSLAILQGDLRDQKCALGGRWISRTINLEIVQQWLAKCSNLHPVTCTPMWTSELRSIRLVDVQTRMVVPHPETPCDYIALSYVMGHTKQLICKLGPLPKQLPRTIEDSIELVHQLGKRYLWVDTLCIDQSENHEKYAQIGKMDIIYRGAYATIISLSGASADSGLPRVQRSTPYIPQLSCRVGDKTLVTLMPTLSQQIFTSPWGSRSWTLQEALLSRRCIYISEHQVYLECNAMQCCESLDESQSWVHNTYRGVDFLANGHSEPTVGAGVLRSPFTGTLKSLRNDRLGMYIVLTNLYNYRNMTYQSDSLNAFIGILQYLKEVAYPRGFFWGLPLEDLNWALSWNSRSVAIRRPEFPSWSWAGSQGWKWSSSVMDETNPQKWPVFMRTFRLLDGELELLFEADHQRLEDVHDTKNTNAAEHPPLLQQEDPLWCAAQAVLPRIDHFETDNCSESMCAQLLVIEAITLTFQPHCNEHCGYGIDGYEYWHQTIEPPANKETGTVEFYLRAMVDDEALKHIVDLRQPHSFLLLGREALPDEVRFTLLAMKARAQCQNYSAGSEHAARTISGLCKATAESESMQAGGHRIMERGTVVHLDVPEPHVSRVLRALRPEKKRVTLT